MANKKIHNKAKIINITKDYKADYKPASKNAFAEFIREKRKEYNERTGQELSTKSLGTMIGIKYEMFRKILNQEKPTKKRDCIIAICVALRLLPGEINEALSLYQYMPALDTENPRERFIFYLASDKKGVTVQELNDRLIQCGFPGLDIQNKRDSKQKTKTIAVSANTPHFKILEIKVRTPIDAEYYYGDPYNSLCTTYDPSRCKVTGDMILSDSESQKHIHLVANTDGYISAQFINIDDHPKSFMSLDETGNYKNYFIKLKNAINVERDRLMNILNDTKNYYIRTSAALSGDYICVFTEQFNYTIPELNEYYILSLSSGHYNLHVYNRSAFMAWYLPEEKYKNHFGITPPEPIEIYHSLEELEIFIKESKKKPDIHIHYQMRKNIFKQLMPIVDNLYQRIKRRDVFIQNLQWIYENPADVLRHYKLESDFKCKYDEEYGEICYFTDSKNYTLSDGTSITVTYNDICKAFEFGFPNIQEICRIKKKLGSIESVID